MRILVTTNAAVGHFLPMAPTVEALAKNGHDVRIGCPTSFAPFVRRAGFTALACDPVEVVVPVPEPPPPQKRGARLIWAVTLSWPSDCRAWVDSLLQQAQQWRPDLVVVEPVEHAGRIVAATLGVPLVVHGWGFTLPGFVEDVASSAILDLYKGVCAAPTRPALVADLGPATVQAADSGPARRYRYQPTSVAGDPLPPPRTSKPRVLISLGTYPNADAAPLIRATVDAALDTGADVIAVLGNEDRDSPKALPPNATVLDWVDMPTAIRGCDLVVHHGGAGISWTTLSCGKPAVVLPQAGDQFRNAQLLSAAGAALVSFSRQTVDLTATIARGLSDSKLMERAAAIALANAAMPDVNDLAHHIAALTTRPADGLFGAP